MVPRLKAVVHNYQSIHILESSTRSETEKYAHSQSRILVWTCTH